MKKLLLLTNALCFSFLFASCQNNPKPKNENVVEPKPTIKDTALAKDTTKVVNQTSPSGTVGGTGTGTSKDTTSKPVKAKPPIKHNAPDQSKIDSIKKSKQKNKK